MTISKKALINYINKKTDYILEKWRNEIGKILKECEYGVAADLYDIARWSLNAERHLVAAKALEDMKEELINGRIRENE